MRLAPIVLFAYNRPIHVKQTLESLHKNILALQSDLYVYVDGPKPNATPIQLENIERVKQVAQEKKWCNTVTVIESQQNKGLAQSIIEGVTAIVNKYGTVIVIEDDVLLSEYFLEFMNDALQKYENNTKVLSIGSWNYFCPPKLLKDNFFYRFPDSIAWATFDRAWKLFEFESAVALDKIKNQKKINEFNGNLSAPYFSNMLAQQIDGKINSWAIRWTATAIIHDMLSFFPRETLSKHIGFGSDATHETDGLDYNAHLILASRPQIIKNIDVKEDPVAIKEWRKFISLNFIPKNEFKIRALLKKIIPTPVLNIIRKR